MNLGGLHIGRLSATEAQQLLSRARADAPTYEFVGLTLDPERWTNPKLYWRQREVGRGEEAFVAARQALQSWVPQRAIADIVDPAPAVKTGETVVIILRRGPFWVAAPDRVVAVIDEARRFGFAYGTLPGHAERGEEGFTVEWQTDGTVLATIRVLAGPATPAARAAAPVVRLLQRVALARYLEAIAGHVAATTGRT